MLNRNAVSLMQENMTTIQVEINPKTSPDGALLHSAVQPAPAEFPDSNAYHHHPRSAPMPAAPAQFQVYTFKINTSEFPVIGDHVVVSTTKGMRVGVIREVHASPQIDLHADYDYKWVVGKINMDDYLATLHREKAFTTALEEIERQKQREEVRKSFAESMGDSDLLTNMFNGAISSLNQKLEAPVADTPVQQAPVYEAAPQAATPLQPKDA